MQLSKSPSLVELVLALLFTVCQCQPQLFGGGLGGGGLGGGSSSASDFGNVFSKKRVQDTVNEILK